MRQVQRFDMRGNTWPSEDGEIVSYKDYAALEKERDAECENWQKQCADLQQKLDAAEEQLAGLHKQEPVGYTYNRGTNCEIVVAYLNDNCPCGVDLFTRPAPAINLAELVPDEMPRSVVGSVEWRSEKKDGLECYHMENLKRAYGPIRAAILRKIEELNK